MSRLGDWSYRWTATIQLCTTLVQHAAAAFWWLVMAVDVICATSVPAWMGLLTILHAVFAFMSASLGMRWARRSSGLGSARLIAFSNGIWGMLELEADEGTRYTAELRAVRRRQVRNHSRELAANAVLLDPFDGLGWRVFFAPSGDKRLELAQRVALGCAHEIERRFLEPHEKQAATASLRAHIRQQRQKSAERPN